MKIVSLIIFVVLFFTFPVKSQVSNDKILETFLNDKAFGTAVVPGFFNYCDTIHIIDTTHQFSDTAFIKFSKIVIIERAYSEKPPFEKWHCNDLIVTIRRKKNQSLTLSYFHQPSNSVGFVTYKWIGSRLKKVKYEYGQY